MVKMIKAFLIGSLLSFTVFQSVHATPLSNETREKLQNLRNTIETWAPMCNGTMALSKDCYQFDMIEFAGYRCMTGDTERCNDIREAQDQDGRWWRHKNYIGINNGNSFSRDMFMGLMMYFATTRDKAALEKWVGYVSSHKNKMCTDASDNRCHFLISSWGMIGHLYQYLGMKPTFKMRLGMVELPLEMLGTAYTAPKGFELVLLADNISFLNFIGVRNGTIRRATLEAYKRQPVNPLFSYLANGPTEELAQSLMSACPAEASERMDDLFWQRELGTNAKGEMIVIRDDWGASNSRIPVKTMADGHDCIVAMNMVLRRPF